ncbi:MAG TPA: hypothetical protein VFA21_18890 [Pyrinomonadaceae bacterium]|nr:hypothetical protein [Pyrinomonadaceae bacterium]
MKPAVLFLATFCLLLPFLAWSVAARQEVASTTHAPSRAAKASGASTSSVEELRLQVNALKKRRTALRAYLATVPPDSADSSVTRRAISELDARIQDISSRLDEALAPDSAGVTAPDTSQHPSSAATVGFTSGNLWSEVRGTSASGTQANSIPDFFLSRPVDGKPDESVMPTFSWTRDANGKAAKFIIEIATDPATNPDGRFVHAIFSKELDPKPVSQNITLDENNKLSPDTKYYWHVLARYTPAGGTSELLQSGWRDIKRKSTEPRVFRTMRVIFSRLSDKGFTLQKTVAGTDATDGAQFSFLHTFNKDTVYTANFALIYKHNLTNDGNGDHNAFWSTQFSVEGALTSDESQAEDAWIFRGGFIYDHGGTSIHQRLRGYYLSLDAKMESDQDFKTKKLTFEGQFIPTLQALNIGAPRNPDYLKPVQFRWRPYFGLDVGHTFKRGGSSETGDTILRFVPRVRPALYLNFLSIPLGFTDTYVYADDTFYFLPLEDVKRRHNFFTSGFNIDVTPNFGLGLTYKNGETAPKFTRVNTLGGVLTVRFGQQ